MKIAVITRHAISNYGSLLQAIATQKIIEELGHRCEIIDYVRTDEEPENWEKNALSCKTEWNNNPIKKAAYLIMRKPESVKAGKKFFKMQQQYLHLTRRYSSLEELKNNPPKADIYMTGSDQVWGPVCNGSYDDAYFLSFAPNGKRKIAFAASMGKMKLNETAKKMFSEYLPSYSKIAVRENAAAEYLREQGLSCKTVLDPTLMIDGNAWRELAKTSKKKLKKKYILIYQIHNGKGLNAYSKEMSKRLGLPLIRVSPSFHQIIRSGKFIYLPNVADFLNLIDNASFIITDSFHGTAFAINFNTPFAEVLPDNGTSSRNVSILNLTGLNDRIVTNSEALKALSLSMDFINANKLLNQNRERSRNILNDMLSN